MPNISFTKYIFSVDVQRGVREQNANTDKVINIYGIAENCSKACIKILEVVQRELQKENHPNEVLVCTFLTKELHLM